MTLLGIVTDVREVQEEKAPPPYESNDVVMINKDNNNNDDDNNNNHNYNHNHNNNDNNNNNNNNNNVGNDNDDDYDDDDDEPRIGYYTKSTMIITTPGNGNETMNVTL